MTTSDELNFSQATLSNEHPHMKFAILGPVTMAFEAAIGTSLATWTQQLARITSIPTSIVERALVFTTGATVATLIYWTLHESKIVHQHRLKVVPLNTYLLAFPACIMFIYTGSRRG
jgi:hypothetical protein